MTQWKYSVTAASYYLVVYSTQIKNDRATAIGYLMRVLEIEPENQKAIEFVALLKKIETMNDLGGQTKIYKNNKFLVQVCGGCFFFLQLSRICIT
ncbi:MAG: hypothetical protein ABI045_04365 [Flavobacteriales bacterium]